MKPKGGKEIIYSRQHIVDIRCERIDVTTMEEKDAEWLYVDKKGHEHGWHIPNGAHDWSKSEYWTLPTLKAVECLWGHADDGEPIYGTHYYCKRCGELVKPGWKATVFRRYIQGPMTYFIDGIEVSRQEAEQAIEG